MVLLYIRAWANNFFFQITGKKKWYFIHPNNTHLLYPSLENSGIYYQSNNFCINPQNAKNKLTKYCPYYMAILEPGDILFNPSPWWHSVENITNETIAIATRWKYLNIFHELCLSNLRKSFLKNPGVNEIIKKSYEINGKITLNFDEHSKQDFDKSSISVVRI